MTATCSHHWTVVDSHENEDRIRTVEVCEYSNCRAKRWGCYARREGSWGPFEEWAYHDDA